MFLGEDLLAWVVLAFGGAMLAGNAAAMVRRRAEPRRAGELTRAPLRRTVPYVLVGLVATVWALASLASQTSG
ncbi:MAG TPA: hypothetical protein DEP66_06510 [Acidimicrobiaceae bacterium]|nr:hypothetical protein [Acidimicrobiaceae bacterium]HCB37835.1 hypothetical protein [Acidimicrobiaceae bacterium]